METMREERGLEYVTLASEDTKEWREARRAAARFVASRADSEDRGLLLDMLGLLEEALT